MPEAPASAAARFCYLVLCHTDAGAALRLARRVRALSPGSVVVLRHAQGPGYLDEADAAAAGARLLVSGIAVSWGDWSLTAAALELYQHGLETTGADWFVLLSGQDYPVRDLAAWEREVVAAGAQARFPRVPPDRQNVAYVWGRWQPPAGVPRPLRRAAAALWRTAGHALRPLVIAFAVPGESWWAVGRRRLGRTERARPLPVVKGDFWMAVSREAIGRALERHRTDDAVRAFFASTRLADETYLPSLLDADPAVRIDDVATSYARFTAKSWNPVWVDLEELRRAAATPAAFARKVAGTPAGDAVRDAADAISAPAA